MDLNEIDVRAHADRGADLHLVSPFTGEALFSDGKPVLIRVLGRDSAPVAAILKRQNRERVRNDKFDNEAAGLDLLVAVTAGWEGLERDGQEFVFSPENARWLYENMPAVSEQVSRFSLDRKNFFRGVLSN